MSYPRLGVWFIGAKGGVATTATLGWAALKQGLVPPTALVSQLPQFASLDLIPWDYWTIGGHEIRQTTLVAEALRLAENRTFSKELVHACQEELEALEGNYRWGTLYQVGPTIQRLASQPCLQIRENAAEAFGRIREDLREFAQTHRLDHVVVVNVASTEPKPQLPTVPETWEQLHQQFQQPQCPWPASVIYAAAALELGYSYINFTPSLGSSLPSLDHLAQLRRTRHMGYDGKTGETLLKSVLAPMFAKRNLEVMSWVGHNIFGNMDGRVLDDPQNKQAKLTSKDRLIRHILGYAPQTLVSIEYIESLGDWKTAWDHIHFRGFLGVPMVMQFIWQGSDSLLAAPLVLDLVRFTERANRAGHVGRMEFLASFFKSPLGVEEHDFFEQFRMLHRWAQQVAQTAASQVPADSAPFAPQQHRS